MPNEEVEEWQVYHAIKAKDEHDALERAKNGNKPATPQGEQSFGAF